MRIRWRLTWYGIGFTALSLVGFVILITLLVEGTAEADQDTLLGTIADEAAAAVSGADATALTVGVPDLVPDASTSNQPFTTIYDDAGLPLFATGTVDGAALDLPAAVIVEALESGSSEADIDAVRTQVRRGVTDDLGVGVDPELAVGCVPNRLEDLEVARLPRAEFHLEDGVLLGLGHGVLARWPRPRHTR